MSDQFSSSSNSGLLKDFYDNGADSPTSQALEKKRKKARLNQMGVLGVSEDPGKLPDSLEPDDN